MLEALYLHIPFCASRCAYCDFVTQECHDDELMGAYVDALCLSIRRASKAGLLGGIKTIYIGGGTPSYLGPRRLSTLIYLLSVSIDLEQVDEFTLECNPDSLTERMVKDLYALGVDRISLGAQSFNDEELAQLGRIHDATAIRRAAEAVRTRDMALSLDLICGTPFQSEESWEESLAAALELSPEHISIYPLTVEDGTPLAARIETGSLAAPDEDVQADMMERAAEVIGQAGMTRYEVASYALPGHESRHNEAYWSGMPYLGLGCGAASMMDPETFAACRQARIFDAADPIASDAARIRFQARDDIDSYVAAQGCMAGEVETLSLQEAVCEDVMLGFRKTEGVAMSDLADAIEILPGLQEACERLQARGLIEERDGRLVPTTRGWLCGNELYGEVWDVAVQAKN
ncbi:MAG: radical SAM family heme chaperone HemW [Coriobacteriaceae bacterium]|nr:radical SAM family heme chaperone HemW [Coriobacteriaceae bacterium]